MAVHIVIDHSNVRLALGNGAERLLRPIDTLVLNQRYRGRCALIRSESLDGRRTRGENRDISDAQELGYRIMAAPHSTRDIACKACGTKTIQCYEKIVDAKIVSWLYQTVAEAADGDTIALVSGDGDFYDDLVFIERTYEVKIEVWGFTNNTSQRYRRHRGIAFLPLDRLIQAA